MTPCTVSVIIPSCNGLPWLAETLESVLAQGYPGLEIIVVDDGSTDGTAAWLASRHPQVKCLTQNNQGLSAARNRGLREAAGEFIQFLDADDLLLPGKIASQAALLQNQPGYDLVFCRTGYFHTLGGRRISLGVKPRRYRPPWLEFITRRNLIPIHAMLCRSSALARVGFFDPGLTALEDWDYWIRAAGLGLIPLFQKETLALCRVRPGSMSHSALNMARQRIAVMDKAISVMDEVTRKRLRMDRKRAFNVFRLGITLTLLGRAREGRQEMRRALSGNTEPYAACLVIYLLTALFGRRALFLLSRLTGDHAILKQVLAGQIASPPPTSYFTPV